MRAQSVSAKSKGQTAGKKLMRIIPSSAPSDLEKSIIKKIGIKPSPTTIKKFADGETYINILENMRNKDVFIMHTTGSDTNDNLMETYLKADACKRMGANKVIVIMPNFPYARQDRKTEFGEPVSARLNISLLYTSGVDEVITVDLHAAATQGFTKLMNLTELSSLKVMTEYFKKKKFNLANLSVISPDLGGVKRADRLAKALKCDKAVIYKEHTAHNQAKAELLLGDVKGKDCIIYDDIIDTAGTITEAAKMVKKHGAKKVYIAASHGLFNGSAIEKLKATPVEEVIVTNSEKLPKTTYNKIKQLDMAEDIVKIMYTICC